MQPIIDDPPSEARSATKSRPASGCRFEDGLALYRTADILALGYMANIVRERLHGDVTYFNVNRHINPTDVCVASCRLCAFGKKASDPKAYTMSLEEVWETRRRRLDARRSPNSTSSAGCIPELTLDWYLRDAARPEAALPAGASEGVHDGRDRVLRAAARRSADPRRAASG